MTLFVAASAAYVAALAVVDGFFNRLVFREVRKLPYESPAKEPIYALPEWGVIGAVHLVFLPVVFPCLTAWAIGGLKYVLAYLAVLCLVQWDMIFGRIVFDDWFGDTPSIALPGLGWRRFPLGPVVAVRLALCALLAWASYLMVR